ncbi:MAG: glycosyltransferase [Actinomycetota bacterium]|nr:glycosyltransferase [Actinomycetota bacterium]
MPPISPQTDHGTSVWALVVTRNRKELLVQCLRALEAQTQPVAGVIVLDNASDDGTAQHLQADGFVDSRHRLMRSEVNLGGAGGYAEILRHGCETGADWLWLMDDDAEPVPGALALLLGAPVAEDERTVGLCGAVVHRDGRIDPLHRCRLRRFIIPLPFSAYAPGTNAEVDCASFVGLLIRVRAVRAAGLPRPEFFLGYDDAEYSLRLGRLGAIRLVPESVMIHKLVMGGGEMTRRSRIWNRVLRAHYSSSPWEGYWRDLYGVRNFMALKVEHEGLSRSQLIVLIAGYVVKSSLYDNRPLRRLPWLVRFALRGWRGDFRAPTPEAWADYARRTDRPGWRRGRGG